MFDFFPAAEVSFHRTRMRTIFEVSALQANSMVMYQGSGRPS
ncbi:hypothetical protein [Rhodococcus sp. IEGM1428]